MAGLGTVKKFRFGVGRNDLCSLSFKVERSGEEAYLVCRELPAVKHSWHSSGIHRYALHSKEPRPPIESTQLLRLIEGQFWTVARVLFTTHGDWSLCGGSKSKCSLIDPPAQGSGVMVSLGFLPHHPQLDRRTKSDFHKAVIEVASDKFLTVTIEEVPLQAVVDKIVSHSAPHERTSPVTAYYERTKGEFRDALMHFRTKLNTYFYWVHHNVAVAEIPAWWQGHPIAREIEKARQLQLAGINVGYDRREILAAVAPDWEEQVAWIKSGSRQKKS